MSVSRGNSDNKPENSFGCYGLSSVVAASHELKAPLALIRQLSLMLEGGDVDQNEAHRIIRQVTLTSERALRLTSDLTKVARLEDAMFSLEPINPKQICEDVAHEMAPLYQAHGLDLRVVKRSRPALLIANRDLLGRVLMNFSDNALHYAEETHAVEISIGALNGGKTIRLGVRDHGPAVPKDAFYAVEDTTLANPKLIGTRPMSSGLGMYISNQFARAMNGRVGVIRHRDGATFYVDLQASRQMSLL